MKRAVKLIRSPALEGTLREAGPFSEVKLDHCC